MELNGALNQLKIRKRDGRIVAFEAEKISFAIFKALRAVGHPDRHLAGDLMLDVISQMDMFSDTKRVPEVEEVQDVVERVLFESGLFDAAKAYILYRKQHESIRNTKELFSNIEMIEKSIYCG